MRNTALDFEGNESDKQWRCCFCCHVRTATILIGIVRLVFILGSTFAVLTVLLCPQLLGNVLGGNDSKAVLDLPKEQGPKLHDTGKEAREEKDGLHFLKGLVTSEDLDISFLLLLGSLTINILLIYGTVKEKPSFLVPFFCVEVISLCVTSLSVLGYCALISDISSVVLGSPDFPMKDELLAMNPTSVAFILLFAVFVSLAFKAYCIHIIWRCYRFLLMRQSVMVGAEDGRPVHSEDRLPDYAEAVQAEQKFDFTTPPPPYSAVVLLKPDEDPKSSMS